MEPCGSSIRSDDDGPEVWHRAHGTALRGRRRWVANDDINLGVSVRVGTDRAVYVLSQGEMLTVRYLQRGT